MDRELIYSKLSYQIVGFAYDIDNEIGYGQDEKTYCDALELCLKKNEVPYAREYYCPIIFEEKLLAKKYFDFLIDDKIILEVKVGEYMYKQSCSQIFRYLKNSGMRLGIILRFTKNGVRVKRIPNVRNDD